jgi:uncharacterized DUF497 family protein
MTFDEAATVFLDALALTVYDEANSQNEDRWFTLGSDAGGRLLAVAPYLRGDRPDERSGTHHFRPARLRDVNDVPTRKNHDR